MDRQEYINNMLKPCSEETNDEPKLGISKTLVLGVDIAANGDDAVISVMENTGSSIKYINSFTGDDAKILYDILYNKDFESLKQLLKKSVDLDDEVEFEFFNKIDYAQNSQVFELRMGGYTATEKMTIFEYEDLVKRIGRTRAHNVIKQKLIEKIKSEKETTSKQEQLKSTFSDLKSKYSAEVYISDIPYEFGKRILISAGDIRWQKNIYNDEISKDTEDIVCREFMDYYKKNGKPVVNKFVSAACPNDCEDIYSYYPEGVSMMDLIKFSQHRDHIKGEIEFRATLGQAKASIRVPDISKIPIHQIEMSNDTMNELRRMIKKEITKNEVK